MPQPNPYQLALVSNITFRRTGVVNANGSVAGELTIGLKTWPTVERGVNYTWVRKGVYTLEMCIKTSGRAVKCLCFSESKAIWTHLIHDADDDNHATLEGCIAPGLSANENGIQRSADAMLEVWAALGGHEMWKRVTINVANNIFGNETKEEWIARREREQGLR
jgi:hypothetical protein